MFEHIVYCVHVALCWKSMVVLEEFVVEFVHKPPWYEWDICLSENIIVGLYWKHFFKWELSKWRLGWSDQGEEYTCQTKVIQFSKNAASSQEDFLPCRTILCCSVVRSERTFFNSAHSFKHVALLKGMLYVNNTAYLMQKYWLF